MLNPEYFNQAIYPILELYTKLDNAAVADMCRRIARLGKVTSATEYQALRIQEAGLLHDDMIKMIAKIMGASEIAVKSLFEDAGVESIKIDNEIYKQAGLDPSPLLQSLNMLAVLQAGYDKTNGLMKNLTGTTAVSSQQSFINACDLAYTQISTGVFDYKTAIANAVKSVASSGLYVLYPTGHRDLLDVAIRRACLTGVNQSCARIQLMHADDMDCDLVETTAHFGARTSHMGWQGRVFSRSGMSTKYPDFISNTGYGSGAGLCGWNCRHSFFPFFEGLSESAYPRDKLNEYANKTVEFGGKTYSYYDGTQLQRGLERSIRSYKRQLTGIDSALKEDGNNENLKTAFNENSIKLKAKESQLKDFLNQTGLIRDNAREQSYKFNKSVSGKAVWSNKKASSYSTLLGTKTPTGIKVNELGLHFPAQMMARDVHINGVVDALTNTLKAGKIRVDKSQQFIGEHATVTINTETGKLITAWHTSSDRVRALKRRK